MRVRNFLFVALAVPSTRPNIEIQNFHLVESALEQKTIEMWAEKARVYKTEDIMVLDSLTADIFSDETTTPYRAKGNLGVYSNQSLDFKIFGSSELQSPESYTFYTSDLIFHSKEKKLESSSQVEGTPSKTLESGFVIRGIGLDIDTKTSSYNIKKQVIATQKNKNTTGGDLSIHSKSVNIEPRSNIAEFKNNVVVKSKEMTLLGQNLTVRFSSLENKIESLYLDSINKKSSKRNFVEARFSDLDLKAEGLKVLFNEQGDFTQSEAMGQAYGKTTDGVELWADRLVSYKENSVTRIELQKKVRILTNGRDATCEEASFFPSTGEIILNTKAIVKKEDQIVEGEKIRFSTKNSEITVERAQGSMDKKDLMGSPKAPQIKSP
jgi:LPS export ABC transporter protein LptC